MAKFNQVVDGGEPSDLVSFLYASVLPTDGDILVEQECLRAHRNSTGRQPAPARADCNLVVGDMLGVQINAENLRAAWSSNVRGVPAILSKEIHQKQVVGFVKETLQSTMYLPTYLLMSGVVPCDSFVSSSTQDHRVMPSQWWKSMGEVFRRFVSDLKKLMFAL